MCSPSVGGGRSVLFASATTGPLLAEAAGLDLVAEVLDDLRVAQGPEEIDLLRERGNVPAIEDNAGAGVYRVPELPAG